MSKAILITGATGKQGGSVIDAILKSPETKDFTLLAVTRDATGRGAQKLTDKASNVKVVAGNMDNVPALFDEAVKVNGGQPIWGVYSVQISQGKGVTSEGEIKQGNDMIDESIKRGVKVFVYSSVERGGDEASWNNPTPIHHFQTKYHIEQHLKEAAGQKMGWTVLRPVAFMDNLAPGMPSRVFLTALKDTLQGKTLQWVAVSDIGWFAAQAFQKPAEYNHKAIGLAGDELTHEQQQAIFAEKTTAVPTPTYSVLGSFLKWAVGDLGLMINWFGSDGYKVDIAALKQKKPDMKNFGTWLVKDSGFPIKQ